ncbi:unnamed protein product [Cladocopium goreaui]|uniref:Uncharacterized protein n=1 Tax=Cladocopium goreaui TaxID=2562237 RepID=A0A9P1CJY5_9DINO|nr:unnamed protein product [Cladocopium goreaui]
MVEGFSELVQASGVSVPARAKFVGRFLGYTTFGSLTFGLVCGQLGVMFTVGPLVPFFCGSWLGYTLSSISFWRSECSTARGYVRDYPRLLEYVIRTEFPWARMPEVTGIEVSMVPMSQDMAIEKWMQGHSLIRLSWCILAGQSCQSLIQEHQEEKRRELLAEPAAASAPHGSSGQI